MFKSASAFDTSIIGTLILVPGGLAAAGGLTAVDGGGDGDSYTRGFAVASRMLSVAVGIAVGLLFASFVVWSWSQRHRSRRSFQGFTF